jgi:hypothetical protein
MKYLKKTIYILGICFFLPIVAAGFLFGVLAIPACKGFDLAKSMIDSGRL